MTIKLSVKVKPRTSQQKVETGADGITTVWVKSPPVDGKANSEVIKLLAKHYGVSKSCVQIRSGASSRLKQIVVDA
jgi:uncharacterized protein (TIGR00251 family)